MTEDATTPAPSEPVACPVQRPVRPLPVVAWLACTSSGEYALALTETLARKRADGEVDYLAPLTLHEEASARLAALDAAAVADRERSAKVDFVLRGWLALDPSFTCGGLQKVRELVADGNKMASVVLLTRELLGEA